MKLSAEERVEQYISNEIFNGNFMPKDLLPPERQLAIDLGHSRPVIHKALIRLDSQGLVTIIPRKGVIVNDIFESGKLSLLNKIFDLNREGIDLKLNKSMLWFIKDNFENILVKLIDKDFKIKFNFTNNNLSTEIFSWMKLCALGTDNLLYSMLLNEFKEGIINVSNSFETYNELIDIVENINQSVNSLDLINMKIQVNLMFKLIEKVWLQSI